MAMDETADLSCRLASALELGDKASASKVEMQDQLKQQQIQLSQAKDTATELHNGCLPAADGSDARTACKLAHAPCAQICGKDQCGVWLMLSCFAMSHPLACLLIRIKLLCRRWPTSLHPGGRRRAPSSSKYTCAFCSPGFGPGGH